MVEIANNYNLDVDKDDIEELLQVVSEELTNEESLGLEQECKRGKRKVKCRRRVKRTPKKIFSIGFSRSFHRPQ